MAATPADSATRCDRALRAGGCALLAMPFDGELLIATVTAALGGQTLHEAYRGRADVTAFGQRLGVAPSRTGAKCRAAHQMSKPRERAAAENRAAMVEVA